MDMDKYRLQPPNPTNAKRYELLKAVLIKEGRIEDYENIINLLSPPPEITNYIPSGKFKGKKVGIIGGGLAGLSAAFELRKLGFDITIFEAINDRIGGRVYTHYFDNEGKLYGELGAIRIPVSHETTWHYINLFKLDTIPFIQSNPNAFVYVKNTRVRNDSQGRNITEKIYPLFNLKEWERSIPWNKLYEYVSLYPLKKLSPSVRTEILRILPEYDYEYNYFINSSVRQVLEDLKLSDEAINLLTSIDPFGAFLYNSYSNDIQEDYSASFTYMYHINGGMAKLPLAFYKSLISPYPSEYKNISHEDLGKVFLKCGNWVTGIYKSAKGEKVVLKYENKEIGHPMKEVFDYVICAIPYSTLREVEIYPLFSNRKMQAIREINYSSSQKTIFLCRKRFWEEDRHYGRIAGGVSTTDMMIQSIIYPPDHAGCKKFYGEDGYVKGCSPYESGVLTASYNFNQDAIRLGNMEEERRIRLIKRQVEKVHGLPEGYMDSIVLDYKTVHWNREPWFKGAFTILNPGQRRIFSYDMLKPEYNGRVYFAGEHTSATPGWIQGALYTGMIAANNLAYNAARQR